MVDAQHMRAVMEQYAAAVSAGDEEAILSFYAPEGSCQVPVGGPVHEGIDAVRAFYEGNELAETLVLTGPVRVAGREAAAPMVARGCFDGVDYELLLRRGGLRARCGGCGRVQRRRPADLVAGVLLARRSACCLTG